MFRYKVEMFFRRHPVLIGSCLGSLVLTLLINLFLPLPFLLVGLVVPLVWRFRV